jgi:hypothetical protein
VFGIVANWPDYKQAAITIKRCQLMMNRYAMRFARWRVSDDAGAVHELLMDYVGEDGGIITSESSAFIVKKDCRSVGGGANGYAERRESR